MGGYNMDIICLFISKKVLTIAFLCIVSECKIPKALGMESGIIADSQITASSELDTSSRAKNARLNSYRYYGSWQAKGKVNQWLKVNFKEKATITAILTQGDGKRDQWVKSFKVFYSNNGRHFQAYQQNGKDQVVYFYLPNIQIFIQTNNNLIT